MIVLSSFTFPLFYFDLVSLRKLNRKKEGKSGPWYSEWWCPSAVCVSSLPLICPSPCMPVCLTGDVRVPLWILSFSKHAHAYTLILILASVSLVSFSLIHQFVPLSLMWMLLSCEAWQAQTRLSQVNNLFKCCACVCLLSRPLYDVIHRIYHFLMKCTFPDCHTLIANIKHILMLSRSLFILMIISRCLVLMIEAHPRRTMSIIFSWCVQRRHLYLNDIAPREVQSSIAISLEIPFLSLSLSHPLFEDCSILANNRNDVKCRHSHCKKVHHQQFSWSSSDYCGKCIDIGVLLGGHS